jgi:hypothetical protein
LLHRCHELDTKADANIRIGHTVSTSALRVPPPSSELFHELLSSSCLQQDDEKHSTSKFESFGVCEDAHDLALIDLGWYHEWVQYQLASIPEALRSLQVGKEKLMENNAFQLVFKAVAIFLHINRGITIDEVVQHLRESHLLEESEELRNAHRLLVFAVLGWQSMLYRPAFDVCSLDEFAIYVDKDQTKSGLVFDNTKVFSNLADRPLFVLLKAFGNLLPCPPPKVALTASESSKDASTWIPLYPRDTNAYLLFTLLRIQIRWVDSLSLHLDYDKTSRVLSLFRYPSFCISMLQSRGAVFAFASTELNSFDPRADEDDIRHLLKEVLLSFRLLFAQCPRSRKLFPRIYNPAKTMCEHVDPLLPVLCMTKHLSHPSKLMPDDQPIYFANLHFPVLFERIEHIAKELHAAKPNSMGDLLHDRRDKLQWWTFWLVAFVGGIGIALSFIQVILQGLQLARS